jgi:transcriptional regulator with XRE-family HTH domain
MALLGRLRTLREQAGISPEELEAKLILGPGWVTRFESGRTLPSLDLLVVLLAAMGSDLEQLAHNINADLDGLAVAVAVADRSLSAEGRGNDLLVRFPYADHDAQFLLPRASPAELEDALRILRDGLSGLGQRAGEEGSTKANAVARMFLRAVELWPRANPSDLWWFIVCRAYQDPFNHPARFARLDLGQSWKRTAGWALEEVLVRHYGPALADSGIRIAIATKDEKRGYLDRLDVADRLESDKIDVVLVGDVGGDEQCFGVVHVKASFAERRTDDVPMSKALVDAGYCSPLWTMDCKSTPSTEPLNSGELGVPIEVGGRDKRSAKRKDIEDDGYFSACFSYNHRTMETPADQRARACIKVCDFTNPADDAFARFIKSEWTRIRNERA